MQSQTETLGDPRSAEGFEFVSDSIRGQHAGGGTPGPEGRQREMQRQESVVGHVE